MDIPLADVLEALRQELNRAELRKDPNKPLIIDEAEVEITMVVTKNVATNVGGEAKVEFKVLDYLKFGDASAKLNAEGQWEKATTHKLRLKLSVTEKDASGNLKKRTLSN